MGGNKSPDSTQYLYTSDIFINFINIKVEFMPFCALIGQNYDLNTRFSSKFAPVFEMF